MARTGSPPDTTVDPDESPVHQSSGRRRYQGDAQDAQAQQTDQVDEGPEVHHDHHFLRPITATITTRINPTQVMAVTPMAKLVQSISDLPSVSVGTVEAARRAATKDDVLRLYEAGPRHGGVVSLAVVAVVRGPCDPYPHPSWSEAFLVLTLGLPWYGVNTYEHRENPHGHHRPGRHAGARGGSRPCPAPQQQATDPGAHDEPGGSGEGLPGRGSRRQRADPGGRRPGRGQAA